MKGEGWGSAADVASFLASCWENSTEEAGPDWKASEHVIESHGTGDQGDLTQDTFGGPMGKDQNEDEGWRLIVNPESACLASPSFSAWSDGPPRKGSAYQ